MKSMRITYYVAICAFLLCLVVIVVKMTFWPVCVSSSATPSTGTTTCDGWTVAGLSATILAVAATFLGILGAILLAAWWTGLDKRVEDRVAEAFRTQIQTVKSTIDQLDARTQTLTTQFEEMQDGLTKIGTLLTNAVADQQKLLEQWQQQDEQWQQQRTAIGEQIQATGDHLQRMAETQRQLDALQAQARQKMDALDERTEQLRTLMVTHDVRAALIPKSEP